MRRVQYVILAAAFAVTSLAIRPAGATFHLWDIRELYSNHDGSVQFIELFTASASQQFTNGTQIKSNSKTFVFPSNTSSPTANHRLLLATAGFGSLAGGVTPDFTIPSNFFDPAGDHVFYSGAIGNVTFTSAPTDGISSLNYPGGTSAVNSPTNFAGSAGSVNLPPPIVPTGDYNGDLVVNAADYTVWRNTLGQSVANLGEGADGNQSGTIDVGDYDFWKQQFGTVVSPGAGASAVQLVPEPATLGILLSGLFAHCCLAAWQRRRKSC